MIASRAGDIVLVRFPFTDFSTAKQRPALVVNPIGFTSRYGDVVVLALTSRPQMDDFCALQHWREANLPRPTWIKPLIATISADMFSKSIGQIDAKDRICVEKALQLLIDKRFLGHE